MFIIKKIILKLIQLDKVVAHLYWIVKTQNRYIIKLFYTSVRENKILLDKTQIKSINCLINSNKISLSLK